jgi:membrane AbrB-like protein
MTLAFVVRVALTLLLALVAAWLCVLLRTPIPWMIGPLMATAIASIVNAPTESWGPLRNGGQWAIGAALGLYFTPEVSALVGSLWWAIVLGIGWALLLGWGFGAWLYRLHAPRMHGVPASMLRSTSYFAGAIGAASEMTLLSERENARTDLVAASHSLRLLIVTITIPFALQWSGLQGLDILTPTVRDVALARPGAAGLADRARVLW